MVGRLRAPLISTREPLRFEGFMVLTVHALASQGSNPSRSPADDAGAEEDAEDTGDAAEDVATNELEDGEDERDEREDGAHKKSGSLQGSHHVGDAGQVNTGGGVSGGGENGKAKDWQRGVNELP
jgi:hypothetical protein